MDLVNWLSWCWWLHHWFLSLPSQVWLDGMEVTQFTYFQQAGGRALDAPAVEITYGLERILMALQGVNHFKDIR